MLTKNDEHYPCWYSITEKETIDIPKNTVVSLCEKSYVGPKL